MCLDLLQMNLTYFPQSTFQSLLTRKSVTVRKIKLFFCSSNQSCFWVTQQSQTVLLVEKWPNNISFLKYVCEYVPAQYGIRSFFQ